MTTAATDPTAAIDAWYRSKGWTPFDYQRRAWSAYLEGRSGLIHAPTGTGKTQAAWFGPLAELAAVHEQAPTSEAKLPLHTLWVTPLRALAGDTARALQAPADDLSLPVSIELRTGDTGSAARARQKKRLPTALVTTPESLTLLISYPDGLDRFNTLRCIVVDEWHELVGTKRGTQTILALARLKHLVPDLKVWGLSATLGNLEEAQSALLGPKAPRRTGFQPVSKHQPKPSRLPPLFPNRELIHGDVQKDIAVDTIIPASIERFPWAGHLGVTLVADVIEQLEAAQTTLLFTNTRSQAELWYAAITTTRPDLHDNVALHHGSIDRADRQLVEERLRQGLKGGLIAVVCTSSLDLGVDFVAVDRVIQLGSPKGVARIVQRAGRSGHQPGKTSRVVGVPTHAFELVEFSAVREQVDQRRIEDRPPIELPLDVLAQHLVTVAAGGGFDEDKLKHEVRSTWPFRNMTDDHWHWTMRFVERGGESLHAYPQYARVRKDPVTGRWGVSNQSIAKTHRMGIGTINTDATLTVAYASGKRLGSIEEGFITRLKTGDRFSFAGRTLELVRIREMTAVVKNASAKKGPTPKWAGSRFPLSTQLAAAVRGRLAEAGRGTYRDAEMHALKPILELQARTSVLPKEDELLIETATSNEGHHYFLFPFVGYLAHEGLGPLIAARLTREEPRSIAVNLNDYGIELLTPDPLGLDEQGWRDLLTEEALLPDLLSCLNESQMARRQFRNIARVAGLITPTFPGERRAARQVQASSDMFFDVFEQFDPGNLLLEQAKREVLDEQLEVKRLREAFRAIANMKIRIVKTDRFSPLAFPIFADRLRAQYLSSEQWRDRIKKLSAELDDLSA